MLPSPPSDRKENPGAEWLSDPIPALPTLSHSWTPLDSSGLSACLLKFEGAAFAGGKHVPRRAPPSVSRRPLSPRLWWNQTLGGGPLRPIPAALAARPPSPQGPSQPHKEQRLRAQSGDPGDSNKVSRKISLRKEMEIFI